MPDIIIHYLLKYNLRIVFKVQKHLFIQFHKDTPIKNNTQSIKKTKYLI